MSIEVTREAQDRLSDQYWAFRASVTNAGLVKLTLQSYASRQRPTVRHKMKNVKLWDRFEQRSYHSNLTYRDVPLPSDVIDEAMTKLEFQIELPAGDVVGWFLKPAVGG